MRRSATKSPCGSTRLKHGCARQFILTVKSQSRFRGKGNTWNYLCQVRFGARSRRPGQSDEALLRRSANRLLRHRLSGTKRLI
jgi:hypothetical protein